MLIHEYQGKSIFQKSGLPIPRGQVASTPAEARSIAQQMGGKVVVKAQVHAGGRGKAGGVKLASNPDEAETHAKAILGMKIKGLTVEKVLVEEAIAIKQEFYLGITLDRASQRNLLMLSPMGGMDIEAVAESHPHMLFKRLIHPHLGVQPHDLRSVVMGIPDASPELRKALMQFIEKVYRIYIDNDCLLTEINPLALLDDGRLVAADSKVIIDDNALFRHSDLEAMQEAASEDPVEREAQAQHLAYVRLGGDVGIIGNGAGLVMTTVDMVSRVGGRPANFLDIGGGARAEVVKRAVSLVLSDPNVKGMFFNIFGGITRGDEVARGIIQAMDELKEAGTLSPKMPFVIRLAGTRAEEGRALLGESGLVPAETMLEGAQKIVDLIKAGG